MNEQEIGQLQAHVDGLKKAVEKLEAQVDNLNSRLDQGAGGVRVLLWASGIMTTLLAGAAWVGQHLKPF